MGLQTRRRIAVKSSMTVGAYPDRSPTGSVQRRGGATFNHRTAFCGLIAETILSIHRAIVEKFCPKRLRAKWPDGLDYSLGINNHFDGEIKRRNKTADIRFSALPASSSAVPWSAEFE